MASSHRCGRRRCSTPTGSRSRTTLSSPVVAPTATAAFLRAVAGLAVALRHTAETPEPERVVVLPRIEVATSGVLNELRRLLRPACDADRLRRGRRWWRAGLTDRELNAYLRFLRVAVAVRDVVNVIAVPTGGADNRSWGAHLFDAEDLVLADAEALALDDVRDAAIERLLPDQLAELSDAVAELSRSTVALPAGLVTRIRRDLRSASSTWTGRTGRSVVEIEMCSRFEFAARLGWTDARLQDEIDRRHVLQLHDWDDEEVFPVFQAPGAHLHPLVEYVAPRVVEQFNGWPLMLWLWDAVTDPDPWGPDRAEAELVGLGAWAPAFDGGGYDPWSHLPPAGVTAVPVQVTEPDGRPRPYYRVARRGRSPFFLSSTAASAPDRAGRFDLPGTPPSAAGSLYMAESPAGAWAETLNRVPMLRLADLLGREMWTLTPLRDAPSVVDLTSAGATFADELRRRLTQAVAERAWRSGHGGLRVQLRTTGTTSVVLFGPAGVQTPTSAGLGTWAVARSKAELDAALWDYLDHRDRFVRSARNSLRRFPGDVGRNPARIVPPAP